MGSDIADQTAQVLLPIPAQFLGQFGHGGGQHHVAFDAQMLLQASRAIAQNSKGRIERRPDDHPDRGLITPFVGRETAIPLNGDPDRRRQRQAFSPRPARSEFELDHPTRMHPQTIGRPWVLRQQVSKGSEKGISAPPKRQRARRSKAL